MILTLVITRLQSVMELYKDDDDYDMTMTMMMIMMMTMIMRWRG